MVKKELTKKSETDEEISSIISKHLFMEIENFV